MFGWSAYPENLRKQQRKYFQEKFDTRETTLFELELSPTGIWTRQLGAQIIFEWSNVEEVKESPDAFEFYMFNGGGVCVRKRAFVSAGVQQVFMEKVQDYLNVSRTSSNWLKS